MDHPSSGILQLDLVDFRGYDHLLLSPKGHSVVLFGPNGAGKTNILEAVSFLSSGRGLRRAKLSQVHRLHAQGGGWAVTALVKTQNMLVNLRTAATLHAGKERRTCAVHGKAEKTLSQLGRYVSLVWLTPQMDRLFTEGNTGRRQFIDRLSVALHPAHGDHVNAYENALKERSVALSVLPQDPHWLHALERQIAEYGAAIASRRAEVCFLLNQRIASRASAFPRAAIHLSGPLEDLLSATPAYDVAGVYEAKLAQSRQQEGQGHGTFFGPHRTHVDVIHLQKNIPASLCSTGEQKALLLAIILAFAELMNEYSTGIPILLLDEVVAHLDPHRRQSLFEELWALQMQIWMTGTEPEPFFGCETKAQFYRVEQAVIEAHEVNKRGLLLP